jgi:hypothetical protein
VTLQPECAACTTVLIGAGVNLACKVCEEKVCVHCFYGDEGCAKCNPTAPMATR